MVARYLFLGGLAAGALASAAGLLPGDIEHVSMLERDGRHEAAMVELDRMRSAGSTDPRVLLALYKLKIHFGDLDGAQLLIEQYARSRPRDVQAQLGLVRFYQQTQQTDLYGKALAALNERTRSAELQKELIGFYRFSGRYAEEEEVLERASRSGRATTADIERLGLLAASRGDLIRAARALRRVDGRLDAAVRASRFTLFSVLVRLNEHDEAVTRGAVWLKAWQDQSATLEFMDELARAGRKDMALELARRFGGPGSDVTLVAAEMLAEDSRHGEVRQRLGEYASRGLPEEREHAARFVSLAIAAEDYALAVKAARHVGLRQLPGEVVHDLIEALYDDANESTPNPVTHDVLKGFSAEVESRLADPVSQSGRDALTLPSKLLLYVAQLAVADSNRDLALRFLSGVDVRELPIEALGDLNEVRVWTGLQAPPTNVLAPQRPGKRVAQSVRRSRILVRRQRQKEAQTQAATLGSVPEASLEQSETQPPRARRQRARDRQLDRVREARRIAAARRTELKSTREAKEPPAKAAARPEAWVPAQ